MLENVCLFHLSSVNQTQPVWCSLFEFIFRKNVCISSAELLNTVHPIFYKFLCWLEKTQYICWEASYGHDGILHSTLPILATHLFLCVSTSKPANKYCGRNWKREEEETNTHRFQEDPEEYRRGESSIGADASGRNMWPIEESVKLWLKL